jgi:TPP-dependent 2-oxoacid decarboxylase
VTQIRASRIGHYLIERLAANGIEHLFGVPGDYVLGFMHQVTDSPIRLVNTCDEQGAGFAADAYARMRGLGAVCVTYSVGGLKLANTTGQAWAEESPVVVISGAPGLAERHAHPLLHHRIRTYDDQRRIFERITAAQAVLDDPDIAAREIDRVIDTAIRERRPVYLELPRDMVDTPIDVLPHSPRPAPASDPAALAAALAEAEDRLRAARQPVIMVGLEVQRYGLSGEVLALLEHTGIPFAQTLLGKSAIDDDHPSYIGVYAGGMGNDATRAWVESADCVLVLGSASTDLETGIFTAMLDTSRVIHATRNLLSIGHHRYDGVRLPDFIAGLAAAGLPRGSWPGAPFVPDHPVLPDLDPATPITVDRLFARIAEVLTPEMVVIADPGDALFGATDLPIRRGTGFLSPAYYASLGFATPAALGVGLANPAVRPLVLVGDGAFQMTGQELSTCVRFGVRPVVIVLDNDGYATERYMLDGSFNDVLRWEYSKLPDLLGAGTGYRIETDGDLAAALSAAIADTGSAFSILEVRLRRDDVSTALRRLTAKLSGSVR